MLVFAWTSETIGNREKVTHVLPWACRIYCSNQCVCVLSQVAVRSSDSSVLLVFFWCSLRLFFWRCSLRMFVLLWGCQDQHGYHTISQRSDAAGPGHSWSMNSLPITVITGPGPPGSHLGSGEKAQKKGRHKAWGGVAWRGLGRLGRKMEDEAWLNQGGANNSRNSDNSLQQGFLFMSMLAKSKCQEASEFTQIQCHATEFLFVAFLCFLWIVGMAVGSWGWCNPKSYDIHNWAWQVSTTGVLRLRRLPGAMKIAS